MYINTRKFQLIALKFPNRKIDVIRLYRALSGESLRDSKEFVDSLYNTYPIGVSFELPENDELLNTFHSGINTNSESAEEFISFCASVLFEDCKNPEVFAHTVLKRNKIVLHHQNEMLDSLSISVNDKIYNLRVNSEGHLIIETRTNNLRVEHFVTTMEVTF